MLSYGKKLSLVFLNYLQYEDKHIGMVTIQFRDDQSDKEVESATIHGDWVKAEAMGSDGIYYTHHYPADRIRNIVEESGGDKVTLDVSD